MYIYISIKIKIFGMDRGFLRLSSNSAPVNNMDMYEVNNSNKSCTASSRDDM
jgi:hypothetical protein